MTRAPRCAARMASAPQPVPISSSACPGRRRRGRGAGRSCGAGRRRGRRPGSNQRATSRSWSRRGTARTARWTGRSGAGCSSGGPSGRVLLVRRLAPHVEAPQPLQPRRGRAVDIRAGERGEQAARSSASQSPAMYDSPKPILPSAPSRRKNVGAADAASPGRRRRRAPSARPSGNTTRTGSVARGPAEQGPGDGGVHRRVRRRARASGQGRRWRPDAARGERGCAPRAVGHCTFRRTGAGCGGRGTTGRRRSHSRMPCGGSAAHDPLAGDRSGAAPRASTDARRRGARPPTQRRVEHASLVAAAARSSSRSSSSRGSVNRIW